MFVDINIQKIKNTSMLFKKKYVLVWVDEWNRIPYYVALKPIT